MQKQFKVNKPGLRPNTILVRQKINLVYNCGGLGDYIQWTTAMRWVYEANEHLYGEVFAQPLFYELAKYWFHDLRVRVTVRLSHHIIDDADMLRTYGPCRFIMPNLAQLHNCLGSNPFRLAFNYFANLDYVPEGYDHLPKITGEERKLDKFNLPKDYAVVTTEATTQSRMLKAEAINGTTKHLKELGITPVFLGQKNLTMRQDEDAYKAVSPDGLELDGIIDLRQKTSIIEAACILANACVVVGLDNGLLHLASCSNVPIAWGFNTVNPHHRIPPRPGKIVVVMPPDSLPCKFCQSNSDARFVRVLPDFRKCLYDDFKCIDTLNAEAFTKAIDLLLK